jgi:hypothetical protein
MLNTQKMNALEFNMKKKLLSMNSMKKKFLRMTDLNRRRLRKKSDWLRNKKKRKT